MNSDFERKLTESLRLDDVVGVPAVNNPAVQVIRRHRRRRMLAATATVVAVMAAIFGTIGAVQRFPGNSVAQNGPPIRLEIDPASYDRTASHWNVYGPVYENDASLISRYDVQNSHVYGSSVGLFFYEVDVTSLRGETAWIRARLSADDVGYSAPTDRKSDVTLWLNGAELATQRVSADDGRGSWYTWSFDVDDLAVGRNTVEFRVSEQSELRNGLCIYGRGLAPQYADEAITLGVD